MCRAQSAQRLLYSHPEVVQQQRWEFYSPTMRQKVHRHSMPGCIYSDCYQFMVGIVAQATHDSELWATLQSFWYRLWQQLDSDPTALQALTWAQGAQSHT